MFDKWRIREGEAVPPFGNVNSDTVLFAYTHVGGGGFNEIK